MREQGTVAIEDSYVKKFMKAIGWMDKFRTVSQFVILYIAASRDRLILGRSVSLKPECYHFT